MTHEDPTLAHREAARRSLLSDPANPAATVDAHWPPITRADLARCAQSIQRSVLLLDTSAGADPAVRTRLAHIRYRVQQLIQYIRQRAMRVANANTWQATTRNGQPINFPLADGPARVFKEIAEGYEGGFEHALHDFVTDTLRPGDVFVDVGAHIGYTSAFASTTGASVFALEVQRELIPLIEQLAIINGFDQLRVLHAGASSTPGLGMIQRMTPHPGFQLEAQEGGELDTFPLSLVNDAVPLVTLDATFADDRLLPTMVKIDVEGHELPVLEGAARIIDLARTIFVVEFHPHLVARQGRDAADLLAFFAKDRWIAKQMTEEGMYPIDQAGDIRPDPKDPNPKLVFEPRPAGPARNASP
ncbi:FkbM family methyltransferase [Thalassobaculum salexigens]|uniref:FkbM family methyltransferase n=1 Tax=Thalassobaculum salexigens TaxID=455360 RepID=UPI000A0483E3|nr:FkbM family methyltransferase [Thalassobaculum salexigens]